RSCASVSTSGCTENPPLRRANAFSTISWFSRINLRSSIGLNFLPCRNVLISRVRIISEPLAVDRRTDGHTTECDNRVQSSRRRQAALLAPQASGGGGRRAHPVLRQSRRQDPGTQLATGTLFRDRFDSRAQGRDCFRRGQDQK